MQTGLPAPTSRRARRAVLAAAVAGVMIVLFFIAHAIGSEMEAWSPDPADANFNLVVRGFQAGQLNLKKDVPPGLARLADPYDQVANQRYREYPYLLHDMSYRGGRLYFYFGVTPVVVLFWPWAALTGHYLTHRAAAILFAGAGYLASLGIFFAARRRYFPGAGAGPTVAGVLALGLANGLPVLLSRPSIYEVEVACAYALVMLALAAVWRALHVPAHGGRWLAAASLGFGLAVGARPALLLEAAILGIPLLLAWRAAPARPAPRRLVALAAAAAGPLVLIVLGLLIYNFLRFGNPLEFGQRYQLMAASAQDIRPSFHLRVLGYNLRAYLLAPVRWQARFPFVRDIAAAAVPAGHYGMESPYGVLANVPFVWLALAAPLGCRGPGAEARRPLGWFLAAIAGMAGVCILTLGCYFAACGRYEVDFLPALVLLATLGVLGLERALADHRARRLAARVLWGGLLAASIGFNLLASFQHHGEQYYFRGEMLVQLRRYPEAIADFEQALRITPDYREASLGLADAHEQAGAGDEAIGELRALLRQHPDNADAENRLGCDLVKAGRPEEGIAHLERALWLQPDFADAENNLASALMGLGRAPEAIGHFEQALRLDPSRAEVEDNLGLALARTGRDGEAIAHFEHALRVRPDLAEAHGNLGLLLLRVGRRPEGVDQLEQALELDPGNADEHCVLGVVLGLEGRTAEGIDHLERALALRPGFPAARRALQRLEGAGAAPGP